MDFQKAWQWIVKYLLQPIPVLLMLAGAVVLVLLGVKGVNVGGLLDKLLGRNMDELKKANTIPSDRVDSKGDPIPVSTPDDRGMTQAPVGKIESGKDENTIKIDVPGKNDSVEVELPVGVDENDVVEVVVAEPEIEQVEVKPPVEGPSVEDLDNLLNKYKM